VLGVAGGSANEDESEVPTHILTHMRRRIHANAHNYTYEEEDTCQRTYLHMLHTSYTYLRHIPTAHTSHHIHLHIHIHIHILHIHIHIHAFMYVHIYIHTCTIYVNTYTNYIYTCCYIGRPNEPGDGPQSHSSECHARNVSDPESQRIQEPLPLPW
jgi:hypothetical protein